MTDFIAILTNFEAYLLTERRVSDNTLRAYRRDLGQFSDYFAKKRGKKDINEVLVKAFLHHLYDQQLSARSIARKISALKSFFTYAHRRYDMPDLGKNLHSPMIEKKLPKYLTEAEIEALLAAAQVDDQPTGIRNRVMFSLLYVSGMRVSEMVGLKIGDLQFDTGFACVQGKGDKQRMVPLPMPILDMLRVYIASTHRTLTQAKGFITDYLFPIPYAGKIKPISRQSFWMILRALCRQAGIKKAVSPHQLRHSLATHMLKKGVNLRSLQVLLGHENLATVQIYTHIEKSYVRTVYDKKHPRS